MPPHISLSSPSTASLIAITTYVVTLNFFCTAGVIYGWSSLYNQLVEEGQYGELCAANDPVPCSKQASALQFIPAVAFPVATASTVINGILVDYVSTWKVAALGAATFTGGMVLLALSQSDGMNMFVIAYILIGWGGVAIFMSSLLFAPLYRKYATLFRAILTATFTCAGIIFTIINFLSHYEGYTRQTTLLAYAVIAGIFTTTVPVFFPARPYRSDADLRYQFGCLSNNMTDSDDMTTAMITSDKKSEDADSLNHPQMISVSVAAVDDCVTNSPKLLLSSPSGESSEEDDDHRSLNQNQPKTLWNAMSDPLIIGLAVYFAIGLLYSNWINATIAQQLKDKGDDGWWAFIFICIASILPIPTALLIDRCIVVFRFSGAVALSVILIALSYSPLFFELLPAQIATFLLYTIGRAFVVTLMFVFVAVAYRPEHYGRLLSYVNIIAAVVGFLQIVMNIITDQMFHQDYKYVNAFCMITVLPLLAYALYMRLHNY